MHAGKLVFAQLMEFAPWHTFRRLVAKHRGDFNVRSFSCLDRLSLFPWAEFRSTKAAVKLHTLLDLRGAIPTFIHISDGKLHDVNILDLLTPEPGAFYVMDRGYLDFKRLYTLHQAGSFFHTGQVQFPIQAPALAARGSHDRADLRSVGAAHGVLLPPSPPLTTNDG